MRELIADGRATLSTLAEKAGLSVSAVQSRVRRLEAREVIRGYTREGRPGGASGTMLSAFVAITPLDPSQPDDAPARLEHIPEIEACHSVAGEESYVLLVRVASPAGARGAAAGDPGDGERADAQHHHPADILRSGSVSAVTFPTVVEFDVIMP